MHFRQNFSFVIFFRLRLRTSFRVSTSSHSAAFSIKFYFSLSERNAAAYAEGVRHVAPSPPGARDEPRGGDAPRHRRWILRCFFLKLFCKVSRTRACRCRLYLLCVLILTLKPHYRTRKCIFIKISISSFFSAPVANFVRSFNLDRVYRRAIPFAWHYFRCFCFTEIT